MKSLNRADLRAVLFCVPVPVFAGWTGGIFSEHSGEMSLRGKTQVIANCGQGFIGIAEEAFGFRRFLFED